MDSTDVRNGSTIGGTSGTLTEQIVATIAETDKRSVDELKPLYEVIDPDALNALFGPHADGSSRTVGEISFEYAGYWVTVSSNYVIEIEPKDD
ncbi:HalOD1 output domain-containing protein [Haladaptatus pallidirubidus]|uniref:Halobacterial output domain-containing protein n=1 Tax=Haladaptatus pallidirubidus TaxID=1008152 RepID=A0AAV3UJK6_9EURY|nr:HalOD1 output domain-containing protein [Haladaptatus pallidirubidus]